MTSFNIFGNFSNISDAELTKIIEDFNLKMYYEKLEKEKLEKEKKEKNNNFKIVFFVSKKSTCNNKNTDIIKCG